jgi:hypothetical protein
VDVTFKESYGNDLKQGKISLDKAIYINVKKANAQVVKMKVLFNFWLWLSHGHNTCFTRNVG